MNNKITELAFIRNKLASKQFGADDKRLMNKIKNDISQMNTPFRQLALEAICNCENDIRDAKFDIAAQEIQLIHNFPFNAPESWNSDYFYKIELLSYLENVEDVTRIKKLIYALAKLQEIRVRGLI